MSARMTPPPRPGSWSGASGGEASSPGAAALGAGLVTAGLRRYLRVASGITGGSGGDNAVHAGVLEPAQRR